MDLDLGPFFLFLFWSLGIKSRPRSKIRYVEVHIKEIYSSKGHLSSLRLVHDLNGLFYLICTPKTQIPRVKTSQMSNCKRTQSSKSMMV